MISFNDPGRVIGYLDLIKKLGHGHSVCLLQILRQVASALMAALDGTCNDIVAATD